MLGSCRLYCNLFKTADGRSTIGVVETAAQRRLDPRKQRTMEALLAAAQVMFSEGRVDVVTVLDMGHHAGVAVGSIYNNFGSKEGLYAAVVGRALDVDRDYRVPIRRPPKPRLY